MSRDKGGQLQMHIDTVHVDKMVHLPHEHMPLYLHQCYIYPNTRTYVDAREGAGKQSL